MKPLAPWHILRFYLRHPLGRRHKLRTMSRILRWQLGSRLVDAAVAVPFVNGTRLLVSTGMTGATGNIYVDLMEFEDMAFVGHFLHTNDKFLDVGANVGVYTVLAASKKAKVVAVEPVPRTFDQLLDNIRINRYESHVDPKRLAASDKKGQLKFSSTRGATNHVLSSDESCADAVIVPAETLDAIGPPDVTMMKIDVEGFEANVIRGAERLLKNDSLMAILIELNGLGGRYGFSDDDLHAQLLGFGFVAAQYDPFARSLSILSTRRKTGNTLYVRCSDELKRRLKTANPLVFGEMQL